MEEIVTMRENAVSEYRLKASPVNLLHVIDGLGVGGAEMLVVTLFKHLKGYNLHLIVLGKPDTLVKEIPSSCKVTVLGFNTYRDIPACVLFIRRYIKMNNIQVIHSHLYWSNVAVRLASPRKVSIFNCIHNISSMASYTANRLSLHLEKLTYRHRHHIIAVSRTVLDDFKKWVGLKGPATVLYNFIGDEFFTAEPKQFFTKEKIKLVAVGNLRKQKNYPYMLKAFQLMPPHVSLDIYGIGPLKESMEQEIAAHGLNISLRGLQPNMHQVLRRYDAYVMCSTHEGLSVALLEAMSSGLPTFLSDIPVQRETCENAAEYFDLNDPCKFVKKLLDTFDDVERLKQMSQMGIERAALMARIDNYIKKLEALYHQ